MNSIPLYLGQQHHCDYLPGNQAQSAFVQPGFPLSTSAYSQLVAQGFRRSGELVYRPHCQTCSACIPVRIPCQTFKASRIQRRILKKNADLSVIARPPEWNEEHFSLYKRYLDSRHTDGSMANASKEDYLRFLTNTWGDICFYEFRQGPTIVAIAVVDRLDTALSAVYTFFDPQLADRSLGVYAVLWQIKRSLELQFTHLYLGYWIQDCQKMSYKDRYRPLELFVNSSWRRYEKHEKIEG
jgi:arginine-tRNA-protein transferase